MEWIIYFATIAGMQEHPGFNRENAEKKSLEECAIIADRMLEISKRR